MLNIRNFSYLSFRSVRIHFKSVYMMPSNIKQFILSGNTILQFYIFYKKYNIRDAKILMLMNVK